MAARRRPDRSNPLAVNLAIVDHLRDQCGIGGFQGFVVITCAGVHAHADNPAASHSHQVTQGTARPVTTTNDGQGDFCGFPTAKKAYVVESGV